MSDNVAPITVAWQSVIDSTAGQPKSTESFQKLSEAVSRAKEIVLAAKDIQNADYAGTSPKAHITVHPGTYEYKTSFDLEDVFITILPGGSVVDSKSLLPASENENVVDLNSFGKTGFENGEIVYNSPVRFKNDVIFESSQFPVEEVIAGDGISVEKNFGKVTVSHENIDSASGNSDEASFLNVIEFDNNGHVKSVGFEEVDSSGGGVKVKDDQSTVLDSASEINFGQNISAVNPQNESVTVELPGTEEFEISDVENLFPIGERVSKISGTKGEKVVLASSVEGTAKNEVFKNNTETEKGAVVSSVEGIINPQVEQSLSVVENGFSPGFTGVLKLIVNSSNLVTVNLESNPSTITKTSGGGSFVSVSSTFPLKFRTGQEFEEKTQRTGSWKVNKQDLTYGLNKITLVHEDLNGNVIGESQTLRYFLEDDSLTPSVTAEFTNLSLSGTKNLSGITYNKKATVDYEITGENIYQNVYSDGEAVRYKDLKNVEIENEKIPSLQGEEQLNIQKSLSVTPDRIIGFPVEARTVIDDPFEGEVSSNLDSEFEILIDKTERKNEKLIHYFDEERYRADPNSNFDSNLGTGTYDSSQSIKDGNVYGDQLQVFNGKIAYPYINYSQIEDGPNNPDYSSGVSGERTYYGIFSSPKAVSNFVLKVRGEGKIVSKENISFGSNQTAIEIKVPTQTGWLDVNKPFCIGEYEDEDGAHQETNAENPSKTIGPNSQIGLSIGTRSTAKGFNKLYYKIKAPGGWRGEITKIELSWGL